MNQNYYSNTTIFGFHGCNLDIKTKLLNKEIQFNASSKDYDWLGEGIYFWENDEIRALEWAKSRFGESGAVIGAKINLGGCFDVGNAAARSILKGAFEDFKLICEKAGIPLPQNTDGRPGMANPVDRVLRKLDKKIIDHAIKILAEKDIIYDLVRAPFQEGYELFPGSSFREHDHIQICVRNPRCILELFDPDKPM